ncbi:MAG: hypothetical protein CL512_06140 [Actinobacteria bacterium]|nr:hypothetical protein [Actinomycetota bacterium]|tara:strand:+ start:2360 stop:2683 length:324 start_codon:yes stop_codon:yes gene_type:complete
MSIGGTGCKSKSWAAVALAGRCGVKKSTTKSKAKRKKSTALARRLDARRRRKEREAKSDARAPNEEAVDWDAELKAAQARRDRRGRVVNMMARRPNLMNMRSRIRGE